MVRKKRIEPETQHAPDKEKTGFLGSNNVLLPIEQRVKERLRELRAVGKPEFHKDEYKEWHTIEPKMPIAGSLEFGDAVRRISKDEYHVIYDLYEVDAAGKIVTVPIVAGPGDPGRTHKVIAFRVTEVFKKNLPFVTKRRKLEDSRTLIKDGSVAETYQERRDEKARKGY